MPPSASAFSGRLAPVNAMAISPAPATSEVVETVRRMLALPDAELDYARAKLAFDRLIDPSIDEAVVLAELDRLTKTARGMAGPGADEKARLNALRKLIYKSGPWNGFRPFGYDHSNVRRAYVRVKLISHYLETRLGDCVSMPILFLILGDKLGLRLTLASAPLHFYLHYQPFDGGIINLEATSGALPAREEWLRQIRPISDRAIQTGIFMRLTTRRETVSLIATTLLQYLRERRRWSELVAVSRAILQHHPRDVQTIVEQAIGYAGLATAVRQGYPNIYLLPPPQRLRYIELVERNHRLFAAAQAMGWEHCIG